MLFYKETVYLYTYIYNVYTSFKKKLINKKRFIEICNSCKKLTKNKDI